ncbi:MAG: type II toxin-antitoxin system Phd/YefM family antitoxin [Rubrobacteraceae bacterium]
MKKYVKTVNVHEAKTHLSRLLERVSAGEEIIIAKSGKPVARLVPEKKRVKRRKPGGGIGRITIKESFYDPLPEDILRAFEGR